MLVPPVCTSQGADCTALTPSLLLATTLLRPQGHKAACSKKPCAAAADGCAEDCCDEACGGGQSLTSGAGGPRSNPVAAMPGLVFEPKVAKSVVAFMTADTPDKVLG